MINRENSHGGWAAKAIVILGTVIVVLLAGIFLQLRRSAAVMENAKQDPVKEGSAAPAALVSAPSFTLRDLHGKEVNLSDYKGKIVVLNFWATWCPPCQFETPSLVEFRNSYHDRGVEIIGVSLDEGDDSAVAQFAKNHDISYPVVIGTPEVAKAYGPLTAIPTTFIINRDGQIQQRHEGMISEEELKSEIDPLLKEAGLVSSE